MPQLMQCNQVFDWSTRCSSRCGEGSIETCRTLVGWMVATSPPWVRHRGLTGAGHPVESTLDGDWTVKDEGHA